MQPIKTLQRYVELLDKKKRLEIEIDHWRNMAMDEMNKSGLKQIKTDEVTASLAKRPSYEVDEVQFRNWVMETPGVEPDIFYDTVLNKKRVVAIADQRLKMDGEILPFITTNETEYISIRSNKS